MKILYALSAALLLCACGTSYKVAPSAAKVTTKLATARRTVQLAKERTGELEAGTKQTQTAATTTAEHIDASLQAITAKDYVTAAQELSAAKASNALVMQMLVQSYRNVVSLGKSLEQTDSDLVAAEQETDRVNKAIEKIVIQGAKDRAIVEEVNWGFRLGALFYFVKGVLKLGFFGILILIAIVITGLCIGGPTAIYTLRGLQALRSWWRTRKRK